MKITFLGTTCMVPTKTRNQQGILVSLEDQHILVDCGENIQRQLKIAKIRPTMIDKIIISHWHGDHVFGLPGLVSTLSQMEYHKKLEIYGPKGTKIRFEKMLEAFEFPVKINLEIKEFPEKTIKFVDKPGYYIENYKLNHKPICFGFRIIQKDKIKIDIEKISKAKIPEGPLLGDLQKGKSIKFKGKSYKVEDLTYIRKGKKLGIISDTSLCDSCYEIAKDVDLLISESTYTSEFEEIAKEYLHKTAKQAALVAKKSDAKELVLTHFSQRFKTTKNLLYEAKTYFKNVRCAEDFMEIKI